MIRFGSCPNCHKNDKLNELNSSELAKKAVEWVGSPEGVNAITKHFESVDTATENLKKARIIDRKSLQEPMTI